MQYLNDDIDQLYKSAAENYPLNTNRQDWKKICDALCSEEMPPATETKKPSFHRLRHLLRQMMSILPYSRQEQ